MKFCFKSIFFLICCASILVSCNTKKEVTLIGKKKSATKTKNIILLVGDGMGLSQVSASQFYHNSK